MTDMASLVTLMGLHYDALATMCAMHLSMKARESLMQGNNR